METDLVPFGSDQFIANWLLSLQEKIRIFIAKIRKIRHAQSAFQLLLLSANSKINHLTRSIAALSQSDPAIGFFQEFDHMILQAFQDISSCPNLSHEHITQIRLPEKLSGLGLLSASQTAPAAFLGCARQSLFELTQRNLIHTHFDNLFENNDLNCSIPWVNSVVGHWNRYSQILEDNNASDSTPPWSTNMFLGLPNAHLQHTLSHNIFKTIQSHLISQSLPEDKIRITSCSATGAAAFLRCPAKAPGAFFTNQEFQLAIKLRIKAPLSLACPTTCMCGHPLDDYGDHLFKCRIGGEWYQRHLSTVHVVSDIIRSTGLIVQQEVPLQNIGPLRSLDTRGDGRMDIVITSSDFQTTLADVTITHPSPSHQSITLNMTRPLYFATAAEERKIRKYDRAARQINNTFIPMALETFGALGREANKFLKKLASRYLRSLPNPEISNRSILMRYWRSKISCTLQRANAKLIISKSNRIKANTRQGPLPNSPDMTDNWQIV